MFLWGQFLEYTDFQTRHWTIPLLQTFSVLARRWLLEDIVPPQMMFLMTGMYAASANLVLTTGNGVNGFTLDNALGEFILTHPNVRHRSLVLIVDAHSKETRNLLRQRR